MNFSTALTYVTANCRARRDSWPEGEFIFLVPGSAFKVSLEPLLAMFGEGVEVQYRPHIDRILQDGSIGVYTASNDDLLAKDWDVMGGAR